MRTKLAYVALIFGAVAGCGGGDSGPSTTTNTTSAKATTTSSVSVRNALMSMNGSAAAAAVQGIGSAAQGTITPSSAGAGLISQPLTDFKADGAGCTCTATGCTFNNCGAGSGFTMNGTIGVSGSSYTYNLTMVGNTSGQMWNYTYTGTMTISATQISGNFHAVGEGTFSSGAYTINYDLDTTATFNNVMLDSSGCAIGGSVTVSTDYDVSGSSIPGGSAGGYSGSGTVTFGPTCGAAT